VREVVSMIAAMEIVMLESCEWYGLQPFLIALSLQKRGGSLLSLLFPALVSSIFKYTNFNGFSQVVYV
jgi:hypothetical protein